MINHNELRTGNLVMQFGIDYDSGGNKFHDVDGDEIYKVMAISGGNIAAYYYDKLIHIDLVHLDPIELTEEWLLKFGFEKSGQWFVYKNFPIQVNVSLIHNKVTFGYNEEYEIVIKPFVHSMQNLIFALTGEELTSK